MAQERFAEGMRYQMRLPTVQLQEGPARRLKQLSSWRVLTIHHCSAFDSAMPGVLTHGNGWLVNDPVSMDRGPPRQPPSSSSVVHKNPKTDIGRDFFLWLG
eukprot:6476250-Amphidinium_carterae.2